MAEAGVGSRYSSRLHRVFGAYVVGLLAFLLLMWGLEQQGLARLWLGPVFLFASVMMYAAIGIYGRTTEASEYYVAGRRIPAVYNGMATAADWMSAASFISLAGTLYLQGFAGTPSQPGGFAYLLGWTGGFCLVGLLIAPHLRRMNLYTVPDYFGVRYGGHWPRLIAAMAAVLCSFTYVVAQIYGIGLIASRLTGVQFEIGILLGLGGVLLCSFLGGMRAITWTQVAQYVVILLAFLIPVSWLAYKQLGNPLAPFVYGPQVEKITQLERKLAADPAELEVRRIFEQRAQALRRSLEDVPAALEARRRELQAQLRQARRQDADVEQVVMISRALAALPKDPEAARELWSRELQESLDRAQPLGGVPPVAVPYAGDPDGTAQERRDYQSSRLNFLALMFCLMLGTAGLPHLLTRYYTTPSVAQARASVAWSLFFIALVYISAPALAVLVKFEVMNNLVGTSYDALPAWIAQWSRVDPSLLTVRDVNGDRILQWGEIRMAADLIMLATPELAGLPYVVSGLVAAGGLAAALSTADGLLLTISNALVRDVYCQEIRRNVSDQNRVILSKFALLAVALLAAVAASQKPAGILPLVSASFSLAASAFVPALLLGIFWRGTTRAGAVAGMATGLAVTLFYMGVNAPPVRALLGWPPGQMLWFDIHPVSAAVFGVPAGLAVAVAASLLPRVNPMRSFP
ncbi:VC_2705 family sodium/solute symporter [Ramlibacter tataouinensis]|uniref:Candidate sodium ion/solute symporter n=1 Tax=Ramlibacter tataouinensis (strain ATCC BAA-407 / DSM 14655 / LMG 21543 / TTB310) TaxID=365046 RepID=F5Y1B2_RAMTT|nr:VC_2705 family sodium/solute symporter [Ramlibacter tataouinensis]AEG93513.1 Candidate sodium ion/solute symporter [Ramlibacter tataouinensis TTB310]